MSTDNFLYKRNDFAKSIGVPDLYKHIDQFSLFAGMHTIGNKLWTYDLLKKTVGIPGDIFEFGCWKGTNLMFLAKVISLLEPSSPKKVYGFDNFSGLPKGINKDGDFAISQKGRYRGDEQTLRKVIDLFELSSKVELLVGDALNTIPKFKLKKPESLCSFAYLDFDLYKPTKAALDFIGSCVSVGGIIVFDEACRPEWPGETLAMKEFLAKSKYNFEMLSNPISQQPTVALKRIN